MTTPRKLPIADPQAGLAILRAFVRDRSLLTPLRMMHKLVGNVFRITLPGFQPAVVTGPEANRQVLVTERDKFSWRVESDPVTRLLRHGLLVTDGAEHDRLRALMDPTLQRGTSAAYIPKMWAYTNAVTAEWRAGETRDMLVEMRRVALLILMGCLFRVEIGPDMERLWHPILKLLDYISPGAWIVFPNLPRPTYRNAIRTMDEYLYRILRTRRAELEQNEAARNEADMLTRLCLEPDLSDDVIRDQLLTMLIAGHDTSTALLAWTLYLFGTHPEMMREARREVEGVLGQRGEIEGKRDREIESEKLIPTVEQLNQMKLLDRVLKESLRLYPPIHIGNRRATTDTTVLDYEIPAETRVMYSIYLAHRDPQHWTDAEQFCPARFEDKQPSPPPLTYVPFGGGPRNCIGAAFSQVEAKVVLARLLLQFDFELLDGHAIKPHMGATLEPRPGVKMRVRRLFE